MHKEYINPDLKEQMEETSRKVGRELNNSILYGSPLNIIQLTNNNMKEVSAIEVALMPKGTEYIVKDGTSWTKDFESDDYFCIGVFVTTAHKEKQTFKII